MEDREVRTAAPVETTETGYIPDPIVRALNEARHYFMYDVPRPLERDDWQKGDRHHQLARANRLAMTQHLRDIETPADFTQIFRVGISSGFLGEFVPASPSEELQPYIGLLREQLLDYIRLHPEAEDQVLRDIAQSEDLGFIFGDQHITIAQRHPVAKMHLAESMRKDTGQTRQELALLNLKHGHVTPAALGLGGVQTRVRVALKYLEFAGFGKADEVYEQVVRSPVDRVDQSVLADTVEASRERSPREVFGHQYASEKLMHDGGRLFRRIIKHLAAVGVANAEIIEEQLQASGRNLVYSHIIETANDITRKLQAAEPALELDILDAKHYTDTPRAFTRIMHAMLNYGSIPPNVREDTDKYHNLAILAAQIFEAGASSKGKEAPLTIADLILQHPHASARQLQAIIERAQSKGRLRQVGGKHARKKFKPGYGQAT